MARPGNVAAGEVRGAALTVQRKAEMNEHDRHANWSVRRPGPRSSVPDPDEKRRDQRARQVPVRAGEWVTFSIGGLVLGSIDGAARVNLAQLVNRADGKIDRLATRW